MPQHTASIVSLPSPVSCIPLPDFQGQASRFSETSLQILRDPLVKQSPKPTNQTNQPQTKTTMEEKLPRNTLQTLCLRGKKVSSEPAKCPCFRAVAAIPWQASLTDVTFQEQGQHQSSQSRGHPNSTGPQEQVFLHKQGREEPA